MVPFPGCQIVMLVPDSTSAEEVQREADHESDCPVVEIEVLELHARRTVQEPDDQPDDGHLAVCGVASPSGSAAPNWLMGWSNTRALMPWPTVYSM